MLQAENTDIGTQPIKPGLPPFVYTDEKKVQKYSFLDEKCFDEPKAETEKKEALIPCYIPLEELNKEKKYESATIFSEFEECKDGDLKLINPDLLKRQKGILYDVIKKAATQMFEGKAVVGLSLPVRIFQARSSIERICDIFTYAPYYLNSACTEDGPTKIQCCMGFLIAAMPLCIDQWKPFNPLLGETYEATLTDDTKVYCEHTSHHPPVTNYYIVNKNWKISGSITYNGSISGNNFNAFNEGWGTVEFNDGHKLEFATPSLSLKGMLMGTRKVQYIASLVIVDKANGLKGVIKYNCDAKGMITGLFKSSRQDTVKGSIYEYDKSVHEKAMNHKHWLNMLYDMAKMKDIKKELVKIEGTWLHEIRGNGNLIWSLKDTIKFSTPHYYIPNPLPSDCRYREDMIWLYRKNEDQAQYWKIVLEAQQRKDRENRKEHTKKK